MKTTNILNTPYVNEYGFKGLSQLRFQGLLGNPDFQSSQLFSVSSLALIATNRHSQGKQKGFSFI